MKKKITMYTSQSTSIQERFSQFLSAASAKGFSPKTIQVYREPCTAFPSTWISPSPSPCSLRRTWNPQSLLCGHPISPPILSAAICGPSTPFYPGAGWKDIPISPPHRIRLKTPGRKPIQTRNSRSCFKSHLPIAPSVSTETGSSFSFS